MRETYILKLWGVSDGGMTAKKNGSRGIQALQELLRKDRDTGVPPVEGSNERQEALCGREDGGGEEGRREEEGMEGRRERGWRGRRRGGKGEERWRGG